MHAMRKIKNEIAIMIVAKADACAAPAESFFANNAATIINDSICRKKMAESITRLLLKKWTSGYTASEKMKRVKVQSTISCQKCHENHFLITFVSRDKWVLGI
jgi:hypothetical protein